MYVEPVRRLNSRDFRTLVLSALGGTLEFYDFIIFVFFASVMGQLFFPADIPEWLRQVQTFGIFASGYLARPLGGLVMAHFGDSRGRKKIFSFSILLMALPTLMIGLLPVYTAIGITTPLLLLLLRVLQGAAIGGEVPGAWVFVAEHVPGRRLGLACGILTAGLSAGILLGSIVATLINSSMTTETILAYGWRLPFLLGGIFGLIALFLRRYLQETPVFREMQAQKALSAQLPIKTVIKEYRREVGISMLLTWLLSGCIVVLLLMVPVLLQKLHGLSVAVTLQANILAILCGIVGYLIAGVLIDRFGAGIVLLIGCIFMAVASWIFFLIAGSNLTYLFISYGVAGLSVGTIAVVPYVMLMMFPAQVRFTGLSFSYNLAYAVFGGMTPILISLMVTITPLAPAWYLLFLALNGILIVYWLVGKTRHQVLITTVNTQ